MSPDLIFSRQRVRGYSWVFVGAGVLALLGSVLLGHFPLAANGQPFLPDFLAHWTGGRLVLDGRPSDLYDPLVQSALQHREVGSSGLSWFVSPPIAAFLYTPFAALSYGWAAAAWLLLDLVLMSMAVKACLPLMTGRLAGHRGTFVLALVATPGVFEAIGSGQDSVLALLVWVLGLRLLLAGRDVGGGALLSLGLFKPQLFVLVPVLLLAQRRWRALGSFCAGSALLAVVPLLLTGPDGYRAWLAALGSPLYADKVQAGQAWKMVSLPALLGPVLPLSTVVGAAFVVAAAAVVLKRLRRGRVDFATAAATVPLLTVVSSSHVVLYDMVFLVPTLVWALSRLDWWLLRWPLTAVVALQWCTPLLHAVADRVPGAGGVDAAWSAIPLTVLLVRCLQVGVRGRRVAAPMESRGRPVDAGDVPTD